MGSNREKQLAKNTLILSIGTFGSKVFTFFLLPLYTAVLTTEDYGNVDILQSVIQLAVPIITLQLSAALFRFLIDQKTFKDKREVVSTGMLVVIANVCICSTVLILFNCIHSIQYFGLFLFCFLTATLYLIAQSIIRGFGNNVLYSLCGFIQMTTALLINVVLILDLGFKGDSILIAQGGSQLIAALVIVIKERLWKYCSLNGFSKSRLKELTSYSLPLIPNEISWWITNTSDRLLILYYLGSGYNGIYAAANKIPNIFVAFYSVFNTAWVESAARSVNDKDRESYYNNMIEKSYRFFGCLCIGIICSMSLAFKFLIGEAYAGAYHHVYILTLAIFVNSMCALYGGIFGAFKQSEIISSTTVYGALINIVINFLFISFFGLYAASVSTLLSYLVVLVIRTLKIKKNVSLKIPKSYFARGAVALAVVTFGYFSRNDILNVIILLCLFVWSFIENKKILLAIVHTIFRRLDSISKR